MGVANLRPGLSRGEQGSPLPVYSNGFRNRMLQRLTGPDAISATRLSHETGVSQQTLSRWLRAARRFRSMNEPTPPSSSPSEHLSSLSAEEKLRIVLEASALPEAELGAFLRRQGLHASQIEEWRARITEALSEKARPKPKALPKDAKRIRELERELHRKDRALAEVTALLALKKKLQTLWGDEGENTPPRNAT